MAKHFLRLSNKWSELVTPTDEVLYLFNSSGSPVKVILSDKQEETSGLDSTKYRPFTIGGTIAQLHAPETYIYAKAMIPDSSEIVVATSDTRIDVNDQEGIKDDIDRLTVEVMRLSNRVTSNQIDQHKLIGHYRIFTSQMIYSHIWNSKALTRTTKQILYLHKRLFAAETYIHQHRKDWINLQYRLEDILNVGDVAKRLDELSTQASRTAVEVSNLTTRLNELVPRIEEAWADYDQLVKEHITPLTEKVDDLHEDFIALNNAITRLAEKHTPEEIELVFDEIIKQTSEEMVAPLTGLKNFLVELSIASIDNRRQDVELATKVDYSDNLDLFPTVDVVANITGTETVPNPEPEPEPEPEGDNNQD